MALYLLIETATYTGSVALSQDGSILGQIWLGEGEKHIKTLAPAVRELLFQNNQTKQDLSAIAVSIGPGSYTGLRIAVSYAKGFAMALDIPILSVPTLQILAVSIFRKHDVDLAIPLIDARRMEVYTSAYDSQLSVYSETAPMVLEPSSFDRYCDKKVVFAGNGAPKAADIIHHQNFLFDKSLKLQAADMSRLAHAKFCSENFEDITEFQPFYLKEFVAGAPSTKIKSILGI